MLKSFSLSILFFFYSLLSNAQDAPGKKPEYPINFHGDTSMINYLKRMGVEFDTTYYQNGLIKSIARKVDNVKDGKECIYDENGSGIWKTFSYENDSLNGLFWEYDLTYGYVKLDGYFKNGLRDGEWNYYDASKQNKIMTEVYDNGKLVQTIKK